MRQYVGAFAIAAVLVSGAAVIQVKLNVQEQREELRSLARQIEADERAMRTLKAEWVYLTTPARLQRQSIDFLALMPTSPEQVIAGIDAIPYRIGSDGDIVPPESVIRPARQAPAAASPAKQRQAVLQSVHYTLRTEEAQSD